VAASALQCYRSHSITQLSSPLHFELPNTRTLMSPIEKVLPAEEGEDWRQLTDAHERRRVQNRIAQRNYRRSSVPSAFRLWLILLGRNIKRRLQQLETFTQSVSVDTQTFEQHPKPARISGQSSIQSEKICLHTITPPASDALLTDIDATTASATESSDTSSIEVALFGSNQDTDRRTSLPNREDCEVASQREHDRNVGFCSITPMTDFDNDVALFVRIS
jgi:hypothetical protein